MGAGRSGTPSWMARAPISVVDQDPDLVEDLDPERGAAARRELRAEAVDVPVGPWEPGGLDEEVRGGLGLLVLEGVLVRRLGTQRRSGAELLGPGDLLRPWDGDPPSSTLPLSASWRVLEPTRLALLDGRFMRRASPYPEIASCLLGRSVSRSRHLLAHLAIAHHPRVDERLLMALWCLADRWGRVTPDGVVLGLNLTHTVIAQLTGLRRPSVSLSLAELERTGELVRRERDCWVLAHARD
jgi:CRP/FNR family transcriptional regulator, cyclic AMP receptor protein